MTVPTDRTPPRRRGVHARRARLEPEDVRRWGDILLTTRERTFLDLARDLDVPELVVIADHLIRWPRPEFEGRDRPYSTPESLLAAAGAHRGRWGSGAARAALARARVGADSPQETRLRLALEDAGLPPAELNGPILTADGTRLHVPDLQWPGRRVAAEYEGPHHRAAEQVDRDIDRAERMRRHGWIEVRVTNRDMRDEARRAVARVRGALEEHGWTGS